MRKKSLFYLLILFGFTPNHSSLNTDQKGSLSDLKMRRERAYAHPPFNAEFPIFLQPTPLHQPQLPYPCVQEAISIEKMNAELKSLGVWCACSKQHCPGRVKLYLELIKHIQEEPNKIKAHKEPEYLVIKK